MPPHTIITIIMGMHFIVDTFQPTDLHASTALRVQRAFLKGNALNAGGAVFYTKLTHAHMQIAPGFNRVFAHKKHRLHGMGHPRLTLFGLLAERWGGYTGLTYAE